ncbi:hypothetical protein GCM10011386_00540 [Parapedobacter defluvii]|uniref:tRNA_anti-like n=1 Tax=Parapedobacter defluvii TaxID=2045106 RepID=A0ABQ1L235_9SPHI|nr:hypothetical protein GCM10011386_00540 [Parapedobacter defluvii]
MIFNVNKNISYLLLALVLITVAIALYLWNKPHRSIDGRRTEHVTAATITQAFEDDETAANQKYLNKALTVQGVVEEISKNDAGQQVIFIKGHRDFSGVQCTFKAPEIEVGVGDTINVSGFCNGYTVAVILDDCKLLE